MYEQFSNIISNLVSLQLLKKYSDLPHMLVEVNLGLDCSLVEVHLRVCRSWVEVLFVLECTLVQMQWGRDHNLAEEQMGLSHVGTCT